MHFKPAGRGNNIAETNRLGTRGCLDILRRASSHFTSIIDEWLLRGGAPMIRAAQPVDPEIS